MSTGFSFFGNEASASLEANVSAGLQQDTMSTFGSDYGVENTTTCTSENNDGAGLYQWVVADSTFETQSFSWHTVCRTGALWNTPPECPWNFCKNADCSECLDGWALDV